MKFLALITLLTGAVMLYLAAASFKEESGKPHWRLQQSFDVIALSIGFVCVIVVAIHVLLAGYLP